MKKVILAQTDTTVGFLSQDAKRLKSIKDRESHKPFITIYQDFRSLTTNIRVPNSKKSSIRRSKKTTFIVKGNSFRVVRYTKHSSFLRDMSWSFSTSANRSKERFDREFCENSVDIIIEDKESLFEGKASKIYKINDKAIKRLR